MQNYFFCRIIIDESRPLNFRYDFIFDRCRALRQEIVIQNFSAERTLRLVEPIVMFLSLSLYQLYGEPISTFDSTICRQHLNECLLSCLSCYDEIEEGMYNHQNRILIEGIYILLNLSEENSLRRALKLKFFIKSSRIMQTVFEMALNMHTRNHFRVINLIPKLPHVLCAIASLKLTEIRKEVLKTFTIAYNSNNLRVSADFIQRVLNYERKEDLHRDLINLGICDDETENLTSINFNRKKFNIGNSCVSCQVSDLDHKEIHILLFYFSFQSHFSSSSINSKINLYEISDIILLRNIH